MHSLAAACAITIGGRRWGPAEEPIVRLATWMAEHWTVDGPVADADRIRPLTPSDIARLPATEPVIASIRFRP